MEILYLVSVFTVASMSGFIALYLWLKRRLLEDIPSIRFCSTIAIALFTIGLVMIALGFLVHPLFIIPAMMSFALTLLPILVFVEIVSSVVEHAEKEK